MYTRVKTFMLKHNRKLRWGLVAVLCMAVLLWAAFGGGMMAFVEVWIGSSFKALSGGFLGWAISRYVVELDLSKIEFKDRPLAALSQAILIGAFAIAVAV